VKFLKILPILLGLLIASTIGINSNLSNLKIEDQFEKTLPITKNTKQIIIAFSKDKGKAFNEFLTKHPNYLKSQNALFFVDISSIPSLIVKLFIVPKFQTFPYKIGLIKEKVFAKKLPKKEGMLTILYLKNFIIKKIEYKPNF